MAAGLGHWARALGRWIPSAALAHAGQPAALFFHGVEPHTLDRRVQTNHHEIAAFRAILKGLSEFDVLPLTAIDAVLAEPERHRRAVFLMSDDGYRNTLTIAADILAEFRLPWTLFVSTAHVGGALANPIFLARLFFFHAPAGAHSLPHFPAPILLGDAKSREKSALSGIEWLRFLPEKKAEEALGAMCASFPQGGLEELSARFASEKFLDWAEVRALRDRGVVIGAHAHRHWPMHAGQSEDYLRRQARLSRARVETEAGPCRFFAYPFGNKKDVGPLAWKAVREAGFTHAFTTLSGSLAAGGNRFLLPRYGLGPRDAHVASLLPLLFAGNRRVRHWQASLA